MFVGWDIIHVAVIVFRTISLYRCIMIWMVQDNLLKMWGLVRFMIWIPYFCFMKWNQSGPKMNLYHWYDCCTGSNKLDALPFYNHLEVKKASFRGASYQLSSSNSQNIWTHKVVFTNNCMLATNTSWGMNMTGPTKFSENRLIFPLCWLSVNAQVVVVLVKAVGCNVSDHRSPLSATTHDLPLAQNARCYPMDVSKQF